VVTGRNMGPSTDATPVRRDLPSMAMQRTIDEGGITMKRLVHSVAIALIATAVAFAAQAAAGTKRPPTTASLMPAYVAAAKYWQSRPLASRPAMRTPHTRSSGHARARG
jgi:hypothetical protein